MRFCSQLVVPPGVYLPRSLVPPRRTHSPHVVRRVVRHACTRAAFPVLTQTQSAALGEGAGQLGGLCVAAGRGPALGFACMCLLRGVLVRLCARPYRFRASGHSVRFGSPAPERAKPFLCARKVDCAGVMRLFNLSRPLGQSHSDEMHRNPAHT